MRRSLCAVRSVLLTAAVLATGCVDTPMTPDAPSASSGLLDDILPGESNGNKVELVHRSVPLAEDETVTRTIGPLGGAIHLPNSRFHLLVPPGAVLFPTTITVVAPAGDLVGYLFFPAGRRFLVPLFAVQNLNATTAELPEDAGGLVAAYVEKELEPTMKALEVLPVDVDGALGTFFIEHFSGYVIATD